MDGFSQFVLVLLAIAAIQVGAAIATYLFPMLGAEGTVAVRIILSALLLLLLVGFAVALLSTTIPWSLEFEALKRMPPRAYGVLVTLEPAIAVLVGIVLLGEALTWRTGLAVTCVTLAAIGVSLFDRRRPGT